MKMYGYTLRKSDAHNIARVLRREGYNVRVTQRVGMLNGYGKGYGIWYKKKEVK